MTQRALLISGPFSNAELAELTEAMRRIERRHPDQMYRLLATELDQEPSLDDLMVLLEQTFPRLPGETPEISVLPRRGRSA